MLKNIKLPMVEIAQFCQRWNLTEFALFGSVLRDDFCSDSSDIDVMIQFHPDAYAAFKGLDYFGALDQMEAELKSLFARDVDIIVRSSIEKSPNYLRRREILSTAKVIYDSSGSSRSV
ncbi:nucleotidyltransferase family protein [cf. Phormidesmis sp. LEGE 11477]|uniref:nucleotidyltransferase family protein n=1 Tax=cf. Phormidesmis sp. LEGE 11477 TaxID=1828680 RepID=UPI00187FDF97|nr:nucleotidyltransferase domain-containing protein [cf. Phormidesmis sp. LEGE 11477]MBE9060788.1 nucleotidyltransferase domain-containing protein [cf. Phormidesmis sp. LEGE 11477]